MIENMSSEHPIAREFSFIHASDLHLGSHQYRNEERTNDFIDALKQILDLAKVHKVDFILLGGDVFNALEMLPGKLMEIISIFKQFKVDVNNQIKIIAIEGNHDIRKHSFGVRFKHRGQSWLKLLASLNLLILLDIDLDASFQQRFRDYNFQTQYGGRIRIKDAIIYGTRYLGETPKEELVKIMESIEKDDGLFHILLQHFGIEGKMENVPGLPYKDLKLLKEHIDYLALGHFHLQFSIDDWVFNPGSSEAACTSDFFFKRTVFLVKVLYNQKYKKEVIELKLNNRKAIWISVNFKLPFSNKEQMNSYILTRLRKEIQKRAPVILALDTNKKPCLYLKLGGVKPFNTCKVNKSELEHFICEQFPVVDVKIYQKFTESVKSIISYL
jgi:DNA repair exonuclease SbcCD nuclease subunit